MSPQGNTLRLVKKALSESCPPCHDLSIGKSRDGNNQNRRYLSCYNRICNRVFPPVALFNNPHSVVVADFWIGGLWGLWGHVKYRSWLHDNAVFSKWKVSNETPPDGLTHVANLIKNNNHPVGDPDGLYGNPCRVSALAADSEPGFALFGNDEWYGRGLYPRSW